MEGNYCWFVFLSCIFLNVEVKLFESFMQVFLKQHHQQWKNVGSAKLRLYHESPTNVKQLVVEADNSKKTVLISTIVLADGVERVGRTGVAVELSDKGARTGIVYMIQLRNETSAGGLFDSLLAGSDRSGVNAKG